MTVDGVERYGEDFEGELTHERNFCCDRLVFADCSFKAGTYEAKAKHYGAFESTVVDGKEQLAGMMDIQL